MTSGSAKNLLDDATPLVLFGPDAHDSTVLYQDFRDGMIHQAGSAVAGDDRDDCLGNGGAPADRIPGAVEIARGDDGMIGKGALSRRQAIVAPLRGQQRFEVGVSERALEIGFRCQRSQGP